MFGQEEGAEDMGYYLPATPGGENDIRRFTEKGIEAAMKNALSNLPRGKRGAVVAYVDGEGVHGAVYGRKPGKFWFLPPGEWSYTGTLGYTLDGELHGAAAVAYSW